jgi:2-polyprenyl-3-methyl-5-hydroxy-6-metoxy-1,4-benzoquinol methylase
MKYQIKNNIEIDSSKTAKSYLQQSSRVVELINDFDSVEKIMDYGCGKMRYSLLLKEKCDNLTIVDSELQLTKIQMIHGERTSIKEYIKRKGNDIKALNIEETLVHQSKYDIIFCSNVLSAIPDEKSRTELLTTIRNLLKKDGKAYFITQYTNSFYCNIKNKEGVFEHLDGVVSSKRGKATYYGIIGKSKLKEMLEIHNFKINRIWNRDQSTYAEVAP